MSGDIAKAKSAYQDFFALWKDADLDITHMEGAENKRHDALRRNKLWGLLPFR
jgi:hypothetical protein